jgi:Ca2+-binding EF-hand superfamily protein
MRLKTIAFLAAAILCAGLAQGQDKAKLPADAQSKMPADAKAKLSAEGQAKLPADPQAKMFADWQQQFLTKFDANNDGKLSDQEQLAAQQAMAAQGWNLGIPPGGFPGADQFAKQFDLDKDGVLSDREKIMASAAFQRMRGGNHMHGGFRGGGGGSGMLPQPAMPIANGGNDTSNAKVNPIVKRFDKDGDGKLNAEEKAAVQAERKKKDGGKADAKPDPKTEKAKK